MANEINQVKVGSTTYTLQDSRVDSLVTGVSSVNSKTGAVSLGASDVGALSLDGGTIKKSKTVKMDASANSNGANLKWGTVNSKNPYIGYASDQSDGTFVIGSLTGTNYASGLAIGGGSGNLLWKGTKVATTSDIPSVPTVNNGTLTITENGTSKGTFTANQSGNTTIALTNTTYSNATTSANGLMSATDKTKLNGISNITDLDLWYDETSNVVADSNGITWSDGFALMDSGGTTQIGGSLTTKAPIVAGSNISITGKGTTAEISYTCGTWSSGTSGTVKLPSAGTYQVRSSASYTSVLWWDGASQAHSPLIRAKAIGTCYRFSVATSGTLTLKEGILTNQTETDKTSTIYYRRIGN